VEGKGPIIIDDEVWIGTNAVIMSGVKIAKGAVVAAGSVVTRDVPSYAVCGGNPARVIKYLFPEEIIDKLTSFRLADVPYERLRSQIDIAYKKIESVDDATFVMNKLMSEEEDLN
jgi:serine acetyltransferase